MVRQLEGRSHADITRRLTLETALHARLPVVNIYYIIALERRRPTRVRACGVFPRVVASVCLVTRLRDPLANRRRRHYDAMNANDESRRNA
jgi:hypothetical protein